MNEFTREIVESLISEANTNIAEARKMLEAEIDDAQKHKAVVPLIEAFDLLRECDDRAKESREMLEKLKKRTSYITIPDTFRLTKTKNISVEGVGRVSIGHRWSCSILEKQRDPAYEWLRLSGNGSLIIETVNAQTLGAFAHERSDAGKDLDPDLFKVSVAPYTSITKG